MNLKQAVSEMSNWGTMVSNEVINFDYTEIDFEKVFEMFLDAEKTKEYQKEVMIWGHYIKSLLNINAFDATDSLHTAVCRMWGPRTKVEVQKLCQKYDIDEEFDPDIEDLMLWAKKQSELFREQKSIQKKEQKREKTTRKGSLKNAKAQLEN